MSHLYIFYISHFSLLMILLICAINNNTINITINTINILIVIKNESHDNLL